ncbi:hypothetical protein J2T60_001744 [Natronospira proteinivora]|uniref:Outer membrane beta-barrel porin/alpha-amylase n=1 Tax=Natronospira proteinivora TaxID=1807133 RepID=A0ABT1G8V2_9GAMM|nr:hypothetical protein [Natronospira proteinivora]MCP1727744.1 hypothetical protein [Natronospira proteinivora]
MMDEIAPIRQPMHRWALALLFLIISTPQILQAGDWAVDTSLGISEGGTWRSHLLVERLLGESSHIYTGLGQTRVDSDDLALDTRSLSLGGGHRLNENVSLGSWYERWGRSGDISSDSLNGRLSWRPGPYRLSLVPGFRWVTLHAGAPAAGPNGQGGGPPDHVDLPPVREGSDGEELAEDFDLLSRSLGLRFGRELGEDWRLRVSATWYDYDKDAATLATREGVENLSLSALTLAQGFSEHRYGLGVSWSFDEWRELGLDLGRDKSAVDGLYSDTLSLRYLTPVGRQWDMELELGAARTEGFGRSWFSGVHLSWYP